MNLRKFTHLFILSFILSSCAFFGSSSPHKKSSLPKAPAVIVPGGSGDVWRYIGTTDDGLLIVEINNNSISTATSKDNTQIFNFQDRKTVVSPLQFTYPVGQPHFKYLINEWQLDCQSKKYLVRNATLYNQMGAKISYYDYTNDDSVKWVKFGYGSIANLEYDFVCLGKNRNLGY